jgi:hypothetical protein
MCLGTIRFGSSPIYISRILLKKGPQNFQADISNKTNAALKFIQISKYLIPKFSQLTPKKSSIIGKSYVMKGRFQFLFLSIKKSTISLLFLIECPPLSKDNLTGYLSSRAFSYNSFDPKNNPNSSFFPQEI